MLGDLGSVDRRTVRRPTRDRRRRLITPVTVTTSSGGDGADSIPAGAGNDVVVGDHGSVSAALIQTTNPTFGGSDTISGGDGDDIILAGALGDIVSGGAGNDVIVGDHGWVVRGSLLQISSADPTFGGPDTIDGGAGNDIVLAGTAADVVSGGAGNDLIFGDHGAGQRQHRPRPAAARHVAASVQLDVDPRVGDRRRRSRPVARRRRRRHRRRRAGRRPDHHRRRRRRRRRRPHRRRRGGRRRLHRHGDGQRLGRRRQRRDLAHRLLPEPPVPGAGQLRHLGPARQLPGDRGVAERPGPGQRGALGLAVRPLDDDGARDLWGRPHRRWWARRRLVRPARQRLVAGRRFDHRRHRRDHDRRRRHPRVQGGLGRAGDRRP